MRKKNKRGFLLAEETLKIVVALIAITFLIYFLTSLYFARINEIEYEKAKTTLIDSDESLKATIENLNEGEIREYLINDPDDWNIVSFTVNTKPNLCPGNSCLCLCKDSSKKIELQSKKCDKENEGICISANIDRDVKIKIQKDITKISIQKTGNEISISEIGIAPETNVKTSFIGNEDNEVYVSEETGKVEEEGVFVATLNAIEQGYYWLRDKLDGGKANVGEGGTAGIKG
ncbi:hypothetical protein HYT25_03930 [Candidatus Pacearchaeota archaeon]|nr:hypothetical protein [Candidatus Pacearchaeota archaeon]